MRQKYGCTESGIEREIDSMAPKINRDRPNATEGHRINGNELKEEDASRSHNLHVDQ